jgi:hypothetical protein
MLQIQPLLLTMFIFNFDSVIMVRLLCATEPST